MRAWIFGLIGVAVIAALGFLFFGRGGQSDTAQQEQEQLELLPPITASERVIAEAEVVPEAFVDIAFESTGTVAEVLVREGDMVQAGDVIARLDTRDLELVVQQRTADLAVTRAAYELLLAGATQAEIDASAARLANAQANLAQREADIARFQADVAQAQGNLLSRQGEVSAADIAAAEAELNEAQAALADLLDGEDAVRIQTAQAAVDEARARLNETLEGAKPEDIRLAQARLAEAQSRLEADRNRLSADKTRTQATMEIRANELRNRQDEYSRIYWDIREIERELNNINQQRWRDLKDREEQALRRVQDAEAQLEQARVEFEAAQQAEITGVQVGEASVAQARAQLDNLLALPRPADVEIARARLNDAEARLADVLKPAKDDQVAAANARIARAQANLERLFGAQRAGQLAAAEASVAAAAANVETANASVAASAADVERARAELENVQSPPREPEIKDREARIEQAQVALKQAQLNLEKATLVAPMSGTIVNFDTKVGERVVANNALGSIADLSAWKVETTDLTELGIVRVRVGDKAEITFDAIPDLVLPGVVSEIRELGELRQGDIVYRVTVRPTEWDNRLRWRMTATVSIEPSDPFSARPTSIPSGSDTEQIGEPIPTATPRP